MTSPKESGLAPEKVSTGGESGGGAYPSGRTPGDEKGPLDHGGQSEIAYHGPGQLGDDKTDDREQPNAPAR